MPAEPDRSAYPDPDNSNLPYSPSWFDRLSAWVERLPLPYGLVYLLVSVFLIGAAALARQMEGGSSISDWDPIYFVAVFQISYILFIIHYLDKRMLEALDEFRPALVDSARERYRDLRWRMSTLPARRTLLVCLGIMALGASLIALSFLPGEGIDSTVAFDFTPFGAVSMVGFLILWFTNGLFVYHTIHQLNAIHYVYTKLTIVHPFHQTELFAFSGFSARTGIAIALITPLWIVFDPGIVSLVISVVFGIFGVLAFLSPLWGVHRMLEREKDRLIDANGREVEKTIHSLMSKLRNGEYDDLKAVDQSLTSLEKARRRIDEISTWPWRTETLRRFLAAILLPLLIWILQYYLSQYLST